jgi:hypothetical protein
MVAGASANGPAAMRQVSATAAYEPGDRRRAAGSGDRRYMNHVTDIGPTGSATCATSRSCVAPDPMYLRESAIHSAAGVGRWLVRLEPNDLLVGRVIPGSAGVRRPPCRAWKTARRVSEGVK